MTQYLLSIYQPDGPAPPPEVLGPVMRKTKDDDVLVMDGPYVEGFPRTPTGLTPPLADRVTEPAA